MAATLTVLMSTTLAGVSAQAYTGPDTPTWADVEDARGDEKATEAEVARITEILAALALEVDEANSLAESRGERFQIAQDLLDEATGTSNTLREEVEEAEEEALTVKTRAGQHAAGLARETDDTTLEVFFSGDGGKDLLGRLSTAAKLAERDKSLFARATMAAQTADALRAQAKVAQGELKTLAEVANEALEEAAAAQRAAGAALEEQRSREAQLQAQLETLRDTRISVEQGYALEDQKRKASATAPETSGGGVAPGVSGAVTGGWTNPIVSFGSFQAYGMRVHPVYKDWRLHGGDDYGASCGTPIFAASAGTVTAAGPAGGYGNQIAIDHGNGITTTYSHMFSDGLRVASGAQVVAGQQIAAVGNAGVSTGCHLHFELRRDGVAIAPTPFLQSQGVN